MTSLFIGLSVGVSVKVSHYYGAGQEQDVSETVHTALSIGFFTGVGLAVVVVWLVPVFLGWMDTPGDIFSLSVKYLRIIFLGMPGQMLYNFASAILRGVGDTKRPLYVLGISGAVNVGFNLLFVIGIGMDVDGVALATILSQYLSAGMMVWCLCRRDACYGLRWSRLRVHPRKAWEILRIGLPAGLQNSLFGISNVLLQTGVNSFGSMVVAASTASESIEDFIYFSMNAIHHGVVAFVGQNTGAAKPERYRKILWSGLGMVWTIGIVMGAGIYLLGEPLLSIYNSDPAIITYGMERLTILCASYFLCGIMEVFSGMLRGMGYSGMPFLVSVFGVCVLRILWLYTIFARYPTIFVLFSVYPFSWTATTLLLLGSILLLQPRMTRKLLAQREEKEGARRLEDIK
jgi:putative MATE family efflux protein